MDSHLRLGALAFGIAGLAFAEDLPTPPRDALLGSLPVVEAAALHAQTLEEAPANVSIITDADIRKYGYRTLAEALSAVRGFFSSSDRIYHYIGVRGFSLPGDYNTRFLVMLNGHALTDSIYDSNGLFGQDFGLDMDLVSRIEIIRGPTAALYGSNGILASINIVTKSPVDVEKLRVYTETGSYGEKKTGLSASLYLGRGANLLVSASVFNNAGSRLRFPETAGAVEGVDGEKGYHTFANLVWHDWSFTAYFNNRQKQPPVPWGTDAAPFQRGDSVRDSRNFVLAGYTRQAGAGKLRWQLYYDQYKYDDRFYYPLDDSGNLEDNRSLARGDTAGTQLTYQLPVPRIGELSVGGVLEKDLRNSQQDHTVYPEFVYMPAIERRDVSGALFVQQEWKVGEAFTVYGGVRLDDSQAFGATVSPRLALVYRWSPQTTYKLVYGRPFRNPSSFEQLFTDGGKSFVANPGLLPETAQTLEASAERKLARKVSVIANIYRYQLTNAIEANFLESGATQYQNTGRIRSQGAELELNAGGEGGVGTSASYSYEEGFRSRDARPANLPHHIIKFRSAAPLARGRVWLAASFRYMSARLTRTDAELRPVAIADLTLSTRHLHPDFDLEAGIRNLAGWRYSDPADLGFDRLPADGRSIFLKLVFHTRE